MLRCWLASVVQLVDTLAIILLLRYRRWKGGRGVVTHNMTAGSQTTTMHNTTMRIDERELDQELDEKPTKSDASNSAVPAPEPPPTIQDEDVLIDL